MLRTDHVSNELSQNDIALGSPSKIVGHYSFLPSVGYKGILLGIKPLYKFGPACEQQYSRACFIYTEIIFMLGKQIVTMLLGIFHRYVDGHRLACVLCFTFLSIS